MFRGLIAAALLAAAPAALAETAPFDAAHWTFQGPDVAPMDYMGQPALRLRAGLATLKDVDLSTGTIAFDVLFPGDPMFTGLRFRIAPDGSANEYFYLRPAHSGDVDSNQYIPVFHGQDTWQIFYGPEYASAETYKFGGWNHVEIRLYPDAADIFINGRLSLRVPDLKTGRGDGGLALSSSPGVANPAGAAFYANFSYTPAPLARPADMPRPALVRPPGLVTRWQVSAPGAPAEALAHATASGGGATTWTELAVETNGVADLDRVAVRRKDRNAVVARFEVIADKAGPRLLRLGYSDAVKVLANGQPVFEADAAFLARDAHFLGTVGLNDAVWVPLKRGPNTIAFVVSDTFGGWAAAAQFADPKGLSGPALAPD